MATSPKYASAPVIGMAQISTANTGRDGSGTLVDIVTGAAAGTRIDYVLVKAPATTTDGMVRLFLFDGTNNRLVEEIPVIAVTPSATLPAFVAGFVPNSGLGLVLPSASWVLKAAPHNAEAFNVLAFGGELT